MPRLVSLGKVGLAAACLLALGCASQPAAQRVTLDPVRLGIASATVPVSTSGPACEALAARIHETEAHYAATPGTWLDAPNRMVQTRRLRVLQGRADDLGCTRSRI